MGFLFLALPVASDINCPQLPPSPKITDSATHIHWQGVAQPYLSRYALPEGVESNYGVGYLQLTNTDGFYYDWPRYLQLPLWSSPDEKDFYGWLQSGQVHPVRSRDSLALTGAGLVETDYEQSSFIVYEAVDDWVQIRLKPGPSGLVWTHRCHLQLGQAKLTYQDWEGFLTEHRDWLHFRSQVPHSLRAGPDVRNERVAMIGLDHKLILHEIRGDWMRMTVQQPDTTCSSDSEQSFSGVANEGWVKWRDDTTGPWVWVFTRGC